MSNKKYDDKDQIIGVHIGLHVDSLFFTPTPIDNDKDNLKLKESVGEFVHSVKRLLNETFNRTQMDDTAVDVAFIDYINPQNVDQYVDVGYTIID